ncbi:phosphocholine cytidylyltransferase family protein [Magnetovibrio blakemorei]|uniref:MobA-like NTP transferase domain-containing protein n=1 Tax=Magnetovibrio blakemorei TaxID=28181 RepID=A0A1E5QC42_9PROT|nr:phosphocholine cytidylyltransferase family protein [Magnetovibrio blakemorei]OEJ69564.1 hypothetical protein BEN30_02485 [Magnetovibrio blakemorei]
MRLIVLAAGTGSRLAPLTNDRPKCLVELGGKPLFEWTLDAADRAGIDEVIVVGGYLADQLSRYDVKVLVNEDFATTNMVHTLFLAQEYFGDGFIMSYGDIVYTPEVLNLVCSAPDGVSVTVDMNWRGYWEQRFDDPLGDAETLKFGDGMTIAEIGNPPTSYDDIEAQYIGLVAFNGSGVGMLENAIAAARADHVLGKKPFNCPRALDGIYMTDLLQGMVNMGGRISALPIHSQWLEIDTCRDLEVAHKLVKQGRMGALVGEVTA